MGVKYLYDEIDAKIDPLSPTNKLLMVTGPLTGTGAPAGNRYVVVTKSPLTGAIAESSSAGAFATSLKYAGYDLLIIEGKAKSPVYLNINDDNVEILPADELWGTGVWHTEEWLKAHHQNPQMKVASIGEAGENGVYYACVVNDLHRAAFGGSDDRPSELHRLDRDSSTCFHWGAHQDNVAI